MIAAHQPLWHKIKNFQFDEPNASFPFSKKLAKEQHWSDGFTQKAIEEYRRFILLCCMLPNGASPSPIVDEVWHLHLTYTTSYWEAFCKQTLKKEIHHYPSKGGNEENIKHKEWYQQTLNLYETIFGEKPPLDIWPVAEIERPSITENASLVKLKFGKKDFVNVVFILLLPFIISGAIFSEWWSYNLSGSEFLQCFAMLIVATIGSLLLLISSRKKQLVDVIMDVYPKQYTIYQVSQFLYGKEAAVQIAIIDLLKKDLLEVTSDKQFINKVSLETPSINNPLFEKLRTKPLGEAISYGQLSTDIFNDNLLYHQAFIQLEKVKTIKEYWQYSLFVVTAFIGIIRVFQGLGNNKPVGFLLLELVVFSIIYWLVYKANDIAETVFKLVKKRLENDELDNVQLRPIDDILRSISLNGINAIQGFSEYPILIAVFGIYAASGTRWGNYFHTNVSSDGSTSSCGSGGGDGGGGGCGGCGGD
ncbi:MAG: hypothetical protein QM541_11990 [Flavobacterium sp.]|nr:hypothetical protein [Flavobacterium sp.]